MNFISSELKEQSSEAPHAKRVQAKAKHKAMNET
jgi:hypothetical protein